jgi:hypothetical protein
MKIIPDIVAIPATAAAQTAKVQLKGFNQSSKIILKTMLPTKTKNISPDS